MSNEKDTFIDKTTLIKTDRPYEFKACMYKDGFKVETKIKVDLDNSIDMDKLHETDPKINELVLALNRFITIYKGLGYKHLIDE